MFGAIGAFLAPYKLVIYGAALAAAIGGVLVYGHLKYLDGQKDCQEQAAEARAEYEQRVRKEERAKAQAALKREADTSKQIANLRTEKERAKDEARNQARAADRPASCNLSDDELRSYEKALSGTRPGT